MNQLVSRGFLGTQVALSYGGKPDSSSAASALPQEGTAPHLLYHMTGETGFFNFGPLKRWRQERRFQNVVDSLLPRAKLSSEEKKILRQNITNALLKQRDTGQDALKRPINGGLQDAEGQEPHEQASTASFSLKDLESKGTQTIINEIAEKILKGDTSFFDGIERQDEIVQQHTFQVLKTLTRRKGMTDENIKALIQKTTPGDNKTGFFQGVAQYAGWKYQREHKGEAIRSHKDADDLDDVDSLAVQEVQKYLKTGNESFSDAEIREAFREGRTQWLDQHTFLHRLAYDESKKVPKEGEVLFLNSSQKAVDSKQKKIDATRQETFEKLKTMPDAQRKAWVTKEFERLAQDGTALNTAECRGFLGGAVQFLGWNAQKNLKAGEGAVLTEQYAKDFLEVSVSFLEKHGVAKYFDEGSALCAQEMQAKEQTETTYRASILEWPLDKNVSFSEKIRDHLKNFVQDFADSFPLFLEGMKEDVSKMKAEEQKGMEHAFLNAIKNWPDSNEKQRVEGLTVKDLLGVSIGGMPPKEGFSSDALPQETQGVILKVFEKILNPTSQASREKTKS